MRYDDTDIEKYRLYLSVMNFTLCCCHRQVVVITMWSPCHLTYHEVSSTSGATCFTHAHHHHTEPVAIMAFATWWTGCVTFTDDDDDDDDDDKKTKR